MRQGAIVLKKQCPWCNKKALFNQLGSRPVQQESKWYQFSRSVKVCPHCAGAVKLGGKAVWFMLLVLPSVLSLVIESFTGYDVLKELNVVNVGWVLFSLGCVATYLFAIFEKVEDE